LSGVSRLYVCMRAPLSGIMIMQKNSERNILRINIPDLS